MRIRIAKIAEAAVVHSTHGGSPKCGRGRFGVGRRRSAVGLDDNSLGGGGDIGELYQGSDGGWDVPNLGLVPVTGHHQ